MPVSYQRGGSNHTNDHYHNDEEDGEDEEHEISEQEAEAIRNAYRNAFMHTPQAVPLSPADSRDVGRPALVGSSHASDRDLTFRLRSRSQADERSVLLSTAGVTRTGYRTTSTPATPRFAFPRSRSRVGSVAGSAAKGRVKTWTNKPRNGSISPKALYWDDRVWYDQFTSTDWVQDSIADAFRVRELRSRRDFQGRLQAFFDGGIGWLLVCIIGCLTALFAYLIDTAEATIFDYKGGYCSTHWWWSKRACCSGASICDDWTGWSTLFSSGSDSSSTSSVWIDWAAFVLWCVFLSLLSCAITLQTKTTISSAISLATLDENLGAYHHSDPGQHATYHAGGTVSPSRHFRETLARAPVIYYPAAGSGVAEVRVILSGFVLHGYLGARTLLCKTIGLIFSVSSGLSVGKEGPYVHIAACIGNIITRLTSKYRKNDAKRREVLSAAAAAGVAVAFGAPIGGVLFALEEVSYYFPPKTLFRTFFCCIAAALSLRALNPYGTNKIVLFEVRYLMDWKFFEIFVFILLGVLGGVLGALFIKASRFWAQTFRRLAVIKQHPMLEVFLVAVVTGLVSFWNRYTLLPVTELLYEMSAPCTSFTSSGSSLCPTAEHIPATIQYLLIAFVIKVVLTTVTFGIKVPAGIYVPSMVVGGLLGRVVGHTIQLLSLTYPDLALFSRCPQDGNPESCVVPGVYALVAAGATMCGVTRLSVTLAVILFELTGSLEHVLPFSLGVLFAKWTADALEPLSIYDLLTDMNAYPYLDHKSRPVFSGDLGDITAAPSAAREIDITDSPWVPATQLRANLEYLHMLGELDGGLPILNDGVLVGLIPGPDLEYALDRLPSEEGVMCLMNAHDQAVEGNDLFYRGRFASNFDGENEHDDDEDEDEDEDEGDYFTGISPRRERNAAAGRVEADEAQRRPAAGGWGFGGGGHDHGPAKDPTDFTPHIDPAPVALDLTSPMDLVYECFVKLGLRYICALRDGKYAGMVHKKTFVRYVKHVQHRHPHPHPHRKQDPEQDGRHHHKNGGWW